MRRFLFVPLIVLITPAAQAQGGLADSDRMRPVAEYLIPETEEIALALSAAPANVASGAEVQVFGANGYARVREGKNGFTCIVQRAWSSPLMKGAGALFWSPQSRFPICYSARAAATIMHEYLRRTELALAGRTAAEIRAAVLNEIGAGKLRGPVVPAIAYMLSPETVAGTGVRPLVPHFMLYMPFADELSLGQVEPGNGLPVSFDLMGTSFATFVVFARPHAHAGGP